MVVERKKLSPNIVLVYRRGGAQHPPACFYDDTMHNRRLLKSDLQDRHNQKGTRPVPYA